MLSWNVGRSSRRSACCSLVWDSRQSTTCAGWELAVCSAVGDVGGPRSRSCSDVGMSVVVASGTRAVGSSETAYNRRHLRANRFASSMLTERFAVVASRIRVVGSSRTAYDRRRLQDLRLGRHTSSKRFTVVASGRERLWTRPGQSTVDDVFESSG